MWVSDLRQSDTPPLASYVEEVTFRPLCATAVSSQSQTLHHTLSLCTDITIVSQNVDIRQAKTFFNLIKFCARLGQCFPLPHCRQQRTLVCALQAVVFRNTCESTDAAGR